MAKLCHKPYKKIRQLGRARNPRQSHLSLAKLSVLILISCSYTSTSCSTDDSRAEAGSRSEAIVFAGRPMGVSSNIYAIDENGELTKFTDDSRWRDVMAHVAKDGSIVFVSSRKKVPKIDLHKNSETYDIFVTGKNSKEIHQITDTPELELSPKFSPDGRHIAYIAKKSGYSELMLVERNGKNPQSLVSADKIVQISWSPDGSGIGVTQLNGGESAIELVTLPQDEVPGTEETLIKVWTNAANEKGEQPDQDARKTEDIFNKQITSAQWSPDGKKIAYIVDSLDRRARHLRVLDRTTGHDRLVSASETQVQQPVTWAEDSESILYSGLVNYKFYYDEKVHQKVYEGGMHIFIADLAGNHRQLTKGDHLHNRPVFSKDGKRIAFLYADKLGARSLSLKTMDFDGNNMAELHRGVAPDSFLYWQDIFFHDKKSNSL